MTARRLLVVDGDATRRLGRRTLARTYTRVKEGVGRGLVPGYERPLPEVPGLRVLTPGIRVNAIDESLGPENRVRGAVGDGGGVARDPPDVDVVGLEDGRALGNRRRRHARRRAGRDNAGPPEHQGVILVRALPYGGRIPRWDRTDAPIGGAFKGFNSRVV